MDNATRICTKCGIDKAITEYHRDKKSPGGRRRQCKPCRCGQTMDWWYENQERQLKRHRDYVDENRERVRDIDNERYYRDRDARADLALSVTHARRARAAGTEYDFSVTRGALRERDGDECHYCRAVMDFSRIDRRLRANKATVDHVTPMSGGGGHTFDNTVLACWSCNSRKGSGDVETFRDGLLGGQTGDSTIAS